MSSDALITSLCAAGRVESRGEFSLDRAQAREKLRSFQVAEPHRYVQNLVALAVLRGASEIAFVIDADDLWARFDGAPLTAEDFEDLYSSSVASTRGGVERARQQLALAFNAALAFDPRFARVTSGPPGARVRLEVRRGAEDRIAASEDGESVTVVHVKQRLRPGLLVRFVRAVRGDIPEAVALRGRCGHAPIRVTIGGEALTCGLGPHEPGLLHVVRVEAGPERACAAGLRADLDAAPELRIVRHGVWIVNVARPHWPPGALAVLQDEGLVTDLSGAEVVHGERLDEALRMADEAVAASTLAWLAEAARGGVDAAVRRRVAPMLQRWPDVREGSSALGRAVAALPWWTTIFGEVATLADLREDLQVHGAVGFTTEPIDAALTAFPSRVLAVPRGDGMWPDPELLLLRDLFGERLRDRHRELVRVVRSAVNRKRWRSRPAAAELPAERYRAVTRREARGPAAEVSIVVGLRRELGMSALRTIAEGHLVAERELALPLPVDVVLSGHRPNAECDGPAVDRGLAQALLIALDAALELVEAELGRRGPEAFDVGHRALVEAFLELRHDPAGWRAWLQAFDVPPTTGDVAGWLAGEIEAVPRIPRECTEVPLARGLDPWLAECARLPTLSGRAMSLGAIAVALERGVEVRWTVRREGTMPWLDRVVLSIDTADRALLRRVFGARVPELEDAAMLAIEAEARFLAREQHRVLRPRAGHAASVEVEGPRRKAVLWVMPHREFEHWEGREGVVVVYSRGRPVCSRTVWMPFPGVEVALQDEALTLTPYFEGVVDDAAWRAAREAVQRASVALAAAIVEAARSGKTSRQALLPVLAASFPSVDLRRAWDRLVQAEGPDVAPMSYECLIGIGVEGGERGLAKAIWAALSEETVRRDGAPVEPLTELAVIAGQAGTRLDVNASHLAGHVLREIRRVCGQTKIEAPLPEQVAGASADLMELAWLQGADGSQVSLLALREAIAGGARVSTAWGSPLAIHHRESEWVVRIFGAEALEAGPARAPAVARGAWSPAERRPAGAIVEVAVEAGGIRGVLWLGPLEDLPHRVTLYDEAGGRIRGVEPFPAIQFGGALCGPGVRAFDSTTEAAPEAKQALLDATLELYERLLDSAAPDAPALRRDLDMAIGGAGVPTAFWSIRGRLAELVAQEAQARGETRGHDALMEILDTLEAESRAKRSSSRLPPPVRVVEISAPPPTPVARLLEALCRELRALRERHDNLLSNFNLEHLRLSDLGPGADPVVLAEDGVLLNAEHPLVVRAAASFAADPAWVDFLASLVFTAFNVWREDISDADEQDFHGLHLRRAVGAGGRG